MVVQKLAPPPVPSSAQPHPAPEQEAAVVPRHLLLHVEDECGLLGPVGRAVTVGYKSFLSVLADNINPVILRVENINNLERKKHLARRTITCSLSHLSSFHLELVIHTGHEVVYDHHLAVGPEPVLLLDAHPDKSLDGGAPGDATHDWAAPAH